MLHKTVANKGSMSGVGLHTGAKATITLVPAELGYGIKFVRVDLPGQPEIPADIDYVVGAARGTTIGLKDDKQAIVHTVEHLMAALAGLFISNVRIEIDDEELPLMDGSAMPFVELINELGIVDQAAEQEYINFEQPMWLYNRGNVALSVFPAKEFYLTLMIDFDNPAIGAQHTTIFNFQNFIEDFASARTFCFLSEVEKLREAGLIKGATLDSAMVVQDVDVTEDHVEYMERLFPGEKITSGTNGFLNNIPVRFPNELCRHKALDLIGDMYLLGRPIKGHVLGARSGHAANHELCRKIREYLTTNTVPPATNK